MLWCSRCWTSSVMWYAEQDGVWAITRPLARRCSSTAVWNHYVHVLKAEQSRNRNVNERAKDCVFGERESRGVRRESSNGLPHCQGHIKGRLRKRGGGLWKRTRRKERKEGRRLMKRGNSSVWLLSIKVTCFLSASPWPEPCWSSASLRATHDPCSKQVWTRTQRRASASANRSMQISSPLLLAANQKKKFKNLRIALLKVYHSGGLTSPVAGQKPVRHRKLWTWYPGHHGNWWGWRGEVQDAGDTF